MAEEFDPSVYVRVPIVSGGSAVSLSNALLTATPEDAPDPVRRAALKLRSKATALQEARLARSRSGVASDPRSADKVMDNSISALQLRLTACAMLDAEHFPLAARAAELEAQLFPHGLRWLLLPYSEEWAEVDVFLRRVDAEGLAGEIDRLAGPDYLAAIRAAFVAYGNVLGVTKKSQEGPPILVVDEIRAVARAIVAYATQVVAALEDSEEPARSALRAALAPLDAHRAGMARRKDTSDKDDEPSPMDSEAPSPPAPVG